MYKNPIINIKNKTVLAGKKPIKETWKKVAEENVMIVGPIPPIFHHPETYILYFLEDPSDKLLFIDILQGNTDKCRYCSWRDDGEDPCCFAAKTEVEWWDEDGNYIGPPKYDPDTGYEDPPECECRCECLAPPIFLLRRPIGCELGTLDLFWELPASHKLVGAVQFVINKENLIITHMAVRKAYQRNKINNFMINQIVEKYQNKKLYFHDLTKQGADFMRYYGGEEWKSW